MEVSFSHIYIIFYSQHYLVGIKSVQF